MRVAYPPPSPTPVPEEVTSPREPPLLHTYTAAKRRKPSVQTYIGPRPSPISTVHQDEPRAEPTLHPSPRPVFSSLGHSPDGAHNMPTPVPSLSKDARSPHLHGTNMHVNPSLVLLGTTPGSLFLGPLWNPMQDSQTDGQTHAPTDTNTPVHVPISRALPVIPSHGMQRTRILVSFLSPFLRLPASKRPVKPSVLSSFPPATSQSLTTTYHPRLRCPSSPFPKPTKSPNLPKAGPNDTL